MEVGMAGAGTRLSATELAGCGPEWPPPPSSVLTAAWWEEVAGDLRSPPASSAAIIWEMTTH